jgi:hypothetical protein
MTGVILKWLRRRWWDFEDAIVDALDWQLPRPATKRAASLRELQLDERRFPAGHG